MAKLTTTDINNLDGNPKSAETAINDNFAAVETAIENTLSRDGTTPNTMSADIDLNSNDLLNVGDIDTTSLSISGVEVVAGSLGTLPTDDSQITHVITGGAGTASQAIERKIGYDQHIVTPEMFGAVGDDTADDLAAIHAARDYLDSVGGGTIYFTKKYAVSQGIRAKSNQKWTCLGDSYVRLYGSVSPGLQYASALHIEGEYTDLPDNETNPTFWGYSGVADTIFLDINAAVVGDLTVTCAITGEFDNIVAGDWLAFLQGPGPNYFSHKRFFAKVESRAGDTVTLDREFVQDFNGDTISTAMPTGDGDPDRVACYRFTPVENFDFSGMRLICDLDSSIAVQSVPVRIAHAVNLRGHDVIGTPHRQASGSTSYNLFIRFATDINITRYHGTRGSWGNTNSATYTNITDSVFEDIGNSDAEYGEGQYEVHVDRNHHIGHHTSANPYMGISGYSFNSTFDYNVLHGFYGTNHPIALGSGLTQDCSVSYNTLTAANGIKLAGVLNSPHERFRLVGNRVVITDATKYAFNIYPYPYSVDSIIKDNFADAVLAYTLFGGINAFDSSTLDIDNNLYSERATGGTSVPNTTTNGGLTFKYAFADGSLTTGNSTWDAGDVVLPGIGYGQNKRLGFIVYTGGTNGTLNGGATTGSITTGTDQLTVNSNTGLQIGRYITIAGVSGVKKVTAVDGTTVTVDSNADATVSGAAVAFSAPAYSPIPTACNYQGDSAGWADATAQTQFNNLLTKLRAAGVMETS